MPLVSRQSGFTLFEVLIYIALFSVIIGSGVLAAFNIFDGSLRVQQIANQEVELDFVLNKLEWALSGSSIEEPVFGFSSDELIVSKNGTRYRFYRTPDGQLFTQENSDLPLELTDWLYIDELTIQHIISTPSRVRINLTVDGETLPHIEHYVRN